MKLPLHQQPNVPGRSLRRGPRQGGMAVIVVLAIVSIALIYMAFNLRTLNYLTRDIHLIEERQNRRLAIVSTNAVTHTNLSATATNIAPAPARP